MYGTPGSNTYAAEHENKKEDYDGYINNESGASM